MQARRTDGAATLLAQAVGALIKTADRPVHLLQARARLGFQRFLHFEILDGDCLLACVRRQGLIAMPGRVFQRFDAVKKRLPLRVKQCMRVCTADALMVCVRLAVHWQRAALSGDAAYREDTGIVCCVA